MNASTSLRLPKHSTLALIAILCLLGASCGINVDREAQVVPGAAEELQRPDTANQPVGNSGLFKVLLYFPGPEDNFYAVQQSFPTAPDVNDILDGIANNPVGLEELERDIDDEAAAQQLKLITTSVNDQMDPKTGAFDPTTGNLIVNMSAEANLAEVTPERRTEIFTQIVCTLTQQELKIEINSIEIFEVDGDEELPVFAQDASGVRNEGPSTRSDYACEAAKILAVPTVESDTQTKRALEDSEANG